MGITGVMPDGFASPIPVPHVDCGARGYMDDCTQCLTTATPQCGWCSLAALCMQVGSHSQGYHTHRVVSVHSVSPPQTGSVFSLTGTALHPLVYGFALYPLVHGAHPCCLRPCFLVSYMVVLRGL